MHVTLRIKRAKRALGGCEDVSPPQEKNLISDLLRSFLGEQQELDDQLPNLVIVFEAFSKRSHN